MFSISIDILRFVVSLVSVLCLGVYQSHYLHPNVHIKQMKSNVPRTKLAFLASRNITRANVGLALSYVKLFTFLIENIYVQFESMVYQQIVGIPMGTNCAQIIVDLFYIVMRGFYVSSSQI